MARSRGANSDHRNGRAREQETSRAAIESFRRPRGARRRLVETAHRPRPRRPISAERSALSRRGIERREQSLLDQPRSRKSTVRRCLPPKIRAERPRVAGAFVFRQSRAASPSLERGNFAHRRSHRGENALLVAYDYLARETSTRFSTINNPFHVVVYAPFLLNSQLFFFQARQPDSMAANSNLALLLVLRNVFS